MNQVFWPDGKKFLSGINLSFFFNLGPMIALIEILMQGKG